jgi:virginiamycin B lyase
MRARQRRRPAQHDPAIGPTPLDFRLIEQNHLRWRIPDQTGAEACMFRRSIAALAGALSYVLVPAAAGAQSEASRLPDGPGKELVEAVCTACHQTNPITRSSGYTRAGWEELIGTMVDLSGSPKERDTITEYLATHFPPSTRRAPTLMPGDAEIAFKEWQVPTLGQRSRDPIQAADGSIWWAGQWGNLIGRIDPVTGGMTEYPLPAGAMPHSVTLR